MVERVSLVMPDSTTEKASADKQKQVRHHNEEDRKRWAESDTQQDSIGTKNVTYWCGWRRCRE